MIFLFFPAIFLQTLTSQQAGFRGNLLYFLKSTSKISSKGFFKDASLDHSNLFTNICSWRPAGHQGQWSLTYHHFALCQIRFLTFFRFFLRSFSGSFLRSYTKTPPSKNPNSENTLDVCAYISKSIRQPKMTWGLNYTSISILSSRKKRTFCIFMHKKQKTESSISQKEFL